ncbi:phage major capsid protein [uncultured Brevundimonas sp.]|uniref:phage major capsid protein n=1 Tax=uncultured Brevundimonas sp. TaxID=213418 RepID=UPI0026182829|nr:phage major capsid protein [uncultured Brevundimonas sp.]
MNTTTQTRLRGLVSVRAEAPTDPAAAVAALNTAWATFKAENDKEMADLKKGLADVVQAEKVDRINADITQLTKAIDDLNKQAAAGKIGAGGVDDPDKAEHAKAFEQLFRKGVDNGIRDLEVKAKLRTTSDEDGGYLVPEETEAGIDRVLGSVSAIRSLATVRSIGTSTYKKLVGFGGATSGWVGEEEGRPETATPKLREIAVNTKELYANPAITQTSLDDSRIDISAWLADEVSIEFAEQEGEAFATGDGVKRPKGIFAYDTVAATGYDAGRDWGKLGFLVSGKAAGFADTAPADALIDLYYSLKGGYRNGAAWLMNDATMGAVRKMKDGQGNYLWAAPSAAAEVPTILQKPVHTDDNVAGIGAGAFPIAFGNFGRGYLIADRTGVRILRDPYTNKPNVHFYTTKRVGGAVVNFEAIKLLKIAAS